MDFLMKYAIMLSCLLLSACANDRYAATTGDPSLQASVLHDCKNQAIHDAVYARNSGAALAAGVIGGAVGGLIVGLAQKPATDPNAQIEACMRAHGYEGTSEN